MIEWRLYYDDGTTFDSDDGPWEQAPLDGVICIVCRQGDRTHFVSGGDYYMRFDDDGTIASVEVEPLLRQLRFVKFGRYTSNRNHERIMARARDDWKGR